MKKSSDWNLDKVAEKLCDLLDGEIKTINGKPIIDYRKGLE